MSFKTGKVSVNDFEMQYLRFGEGEKTLVILPGLSVQSVITSAALIEKQYEVFKEEFTVYLFDRRENLPESYSINAMASDTAEAMTALGIENACVFGTSQGGMIAMLIAAEYPKLVSALALGSTACKMEKSRFAAVEKWIAFAKEGKREELYLSFGELLYSEELFNKYEGALRQISKTVTESDLKRFVILASALKDFDISEKVKSIKCPVLAIGDRSDALLGDRAADDIAAAMKNNQLFELYNYDGFGHAVYDVAPDYQKRLYDYFINK